MFCSSCGGEIELGSRFCSHCGREITSPPKRTSAVSSMPTASSGVPAFGDTYRFAGFWMRTLAYLVDWALIVLVAFLFLLMFVVAVGYDMSPQEMESIGAAIGQLFGMVIAWLYFTVAESSPWQATPGKKLLGMRVVDANGNRIGWWRANGRYWSKILSALMLWIGFLMVGFTEFKQGLHDMAARTFVIRTGV